VIYLDDEVELESSTKAEMIKSRQTPRIDHAALDMDEMLAGEKAVLANEEVREVVKSLGLPEGSEVVADPWCFEKSSSLPPSRQELMRDDQGGDTSEDMPRSSNSRCNYRPPSSTHSDINFHAFPLPFIPTL